MGNTKENATISSEKVIQTESLDGLLLAAQKAVNTDAQGFRPMGEVEETLKGKSIVDTTLAQFIPGMVLYFDPEKIKVAQAKVGLRGNTATVVSVPAGSYNDGKLTLNRAFNAYLSSFRKEIRVTDPNGEPVLLPNGDVETINGKGNRIWEALQRCRSDWEILSYLSGKAIRIAEVKKGYGPSNFMEIGGTYVPKGHRRTSLPLCEEVTL